MQRLDERRCIAGFEIWAAYMTHQISQLAGGDIMGDENENDLEFVFNAYIKDIRLSHIQGRGRSRMIRLGAYKAMARPPLPHPAAY
jgi:hypothetical protein